MFCTLLSVGCMDTRTITDANLEIPGRNWSYTEKIKVPVQIEDPSVPYTIYLNLRHTAKYR